jgi:hypothetical protein
MIDSRADSTETVFSWPWGWRWPNLAPQQLAQPINPGWSFGNLIVNTSNSSAPEVEQEVLSHHSYGRQIGRLTDAVQALADALAKADPALNEDRRLRDFRELAADVQRIKAQGAQERLQRLRMELQALKRSDPQAWKQLIGSLR